MKAMKRILVVDDDPIVRLSFDRVLAPKGHAVIAVKSGEEALARLEAEDYDMVFTDIRMPGMDGIEVARRIKASRPWMPVLIVTGYGDDRNEAAAREAGVSAFLHKPLAPETIEESAEAAASTPHAAWAPISIAPVEAAKPKAGVALFARNVALFFAAPFIALFYVLIGPFVGLGILAWMAVKGLVKR